MPIIEATGKATIGGLTMKLQGTVIAHFALTHFNAAKHFAAEVQRRETENAGQPFGNFWEEISLYCASCVIMTGAALESLINEIFISPGSVHEAVTEKYGDFDSFFWGDPTSTGNGWERALALLFFWRRSKKRGFERKGALEKYTRAAKLLRKTQVAKTSKEYQHAVALIGFRNYLIHFKPLWDKGRANTDLEQDLAGLFALSPWSQATQPFIEQQCMSAGCARWAIETVANFVQEFGRKTAYDQAKLAPFKH